MLMTDQHPHNKHLMVALLGKPNAGKSTLANQLLGFDLSIVSSKPQTTRNHFQAVFVVDRTEIVLVDTPGAHSSNQEINIRMTGQAQFGAEGVDLNLLLVDLNNDPLQDVIDFKKAFDRELSKTWVLFTKQDRANKSEEEMDELFAKIKELIPSVERYIPISAKTGDNIHILTGALVDEAKPGPHFYPQGDVSNKNMRFFASEYIREQAFKILKDELPYELAVVVDDYQDPMTTKDGKEFDCKISATILVNRPSQRAIVVGSKGSVIKQIGTNARKKIEAMVGARTHLNLHVKVSPKWFKNNYVLDELGLPRTNKSNRVWRQK
ncbi:MAG: GTPase Era [Halobacteriovoraceae bacterium]|nr:GTPase Era [Halobacteriovoraceae bacterium]|tara:strand:- start:5756 stop:6724 length:969 start_codon:yes stop_codon:yes gene_type:complete